MEKTIRQDIEYGGWAKNTTTGIYEMLFTTQISDVLCKERTKEKIKLKNEDRPGLYDEDTLKLKRRVIVTYADEWKDMNEPFVPFSQRLKECREKAGMTCRELGRAAGVSEITIRQYEDGERKPGKGNLFKLADALKCTVLELFI